MKKICFLVDSIYTLGGIQRVVTNLANNLCDFYDITIICSRYVCNSKMVDYGLNKKIKVVVIDNNKNRIVGENGILFPLKVLYYLDLKNNIFPKEGKISEFVKYKSKFIKSKKLINYLNVEKFDYILAEGLSECIYLAMLKSSIKYGKIIGCWHASYGLYIKKNSKRLIQMSLETLDKTIVLNNNDKKLIKKNFSIDVSCIPNPMLLKSHGKSTLKNKKFISVGRYAPVKGYDAIIKSFYLFHKRNLLWTLDIYGEGPERDKLQRLIDDYGLNDFVKLCGKVNNIEKYYEEASCLLVGSKDEGFGLCLTEAMSYGLPIIAFEVPVFYEILQKDYNYIVKQGDFESYSAKMFDLSDNYYLRKKIGTELFKLSDKYTIEKIIQYWIDLLK